MKRSLVVLVGLVVLLAPTTPTLAQQGQEGDQAQDGGGDAPSAYGFEGDHLRFVVDRELPGVRNLTIVDNETVVLEAIELPGTLEDERRRDDHVRLETDAGRLEAHDREELLVELRADEGAAITLALASGVQATEQSADDGVRYRLTPSEGPQLSLSAENGTLSEDRITVEGQALLQAAQSDDEAREDEDRSRDAATQGNETRDEPDETERNRSDAGEGDEAPRDRASESEERSRERRTATDGNYTVGSASFRLDGDSLRDLTVRNRSLLDSLTVPGLRPAEERARGPQLELRGDEARLRVSAGDGVLLRAETGMRITATLAEGVDVRLEDDQAFLQTGALTAVAQGDELRVADGRLSADDELRLTVRIQPHAGDPVWRPDRADQAPAQLPLPFEGRFLGFDLNETSLSNLTVHGTPLGEVTFDPAAVDEIRRAGSQIRVEGEGFELHAVDAPAVQLRLEADGLGLDVPNRTKLPSGAEVFVDRDGDEVELRVTRPQGVLANRTAVEHRPAQVPVERTEGPAPGLRTRTEGGELGVTSSDPGTIAASFSGRLDDTSGNVSLQLGLSRAMLVEDTNGNGRLDVGEPAVAEQPLTNGTADVEGDALVNRFDLWSGNLSVVVEPGNGTAKVTYEVENLSAPPGTLFVLESRVQAPPGAKLVPTDDGVVVQNGSMEARYSAAGPVTVDGGDAWADRSIFVDSNDTVRVMLAYPAGDDIVHDPTLSIQSVPGAQAIGRLAASPWAIVFGAMAAVLLVGVTAWQRRRGPRV